MLELFYRSPEGDLELNFHSGQARAWLSPARFVTVLAGSQSGKALALDTPVATPDGFLPLGRVGDGDVVFDDSGRPCRVVKAHDPYVAKLVYRITFDDGSSLDADPGHLWTTQTERHRRLDAAFHAPGRPRSGRVTFVRGGVRSPTPCSTVTTDYIRKTLHVKGTRRPNHTIPLAGPVEFPGAGDTPEPDEFARELLSGASSHYDRFSVLFATAARRLEFLRALSDAAGVEDARGSVGVPAGDPWTAWFLLTLARSLGIKAREFLNHSGPGRVVRFPARVLPWRADYSEAARDGSVRYGRAIVSVEPVPARAVRCLTVDSPSRLYLAGDSFIPTHNTSWGPWWLWREIYGDGTPDSLGGKGPGDYIAVTATYELFKLKMLPAIRQVFEETFGLGRYWHSSRIMELRPHRDAPFMASRADDPMWGRIILRSAESKGGLESTSARAAWLDEAGQASYRMETWEAVNARLSLSEGRALLTTTLYNFDWLKTKVYDVWKKGDAAYDVVHFDSILNPNFPKTVWLAARKSMPPWRFDMRYRGMYTRPAGMIYSCFKDAPFPYGHLIPPAAPYPSHWPRYLGLDFGGVNTAGVFFTEEPGTGVVRAYRTYLEGGRTAREHVDALMKGEPGVPVCFGGSQSEQQWRDEFTAAGLPVYGPENPDVELGIGRVYGAIKTGRVLFHDDLTGGYDDPMGGLLGELRGYSRKLDARGEPTSQIENKERFHRLDCVRYILNWRFREDNASAPAIGEASVDGPVRWGSDS